MQKPTVQALPNLRRIVSTLALVLLVGACGGGSGGGAPGDSAAPASSSGTAGTTGGAGTGSEGVSTAGGFSWSKPADFDQKLANAISQQPAFMNGYGGSVANPFPELEGTTKLSRMQITRPDAVELAEHFGKWSYKFYVDENSRHSNGLRAEFTGEADYQLKEGDTYRFEWSTYFPADYKNSSWTEWNMFAQFHGPGFPAWGLHTAGGFLHMGPPGAAQNQYRVPMPERDQWHTFRWTVRFTHQSTGEATLEIDGKQVFEHRGPTMHDTEDYYYPKLGSYLANNPYQQTTYSTPYLITRL